MVYKKQNPGGYPGFKFNAFLLYLQSKIIMLQENYLMNSQKHLSYPGYDPG